jgi:hypothetical protein
MKEQTLNRLSRVFGLGVAVLAVVMASTGIVPAAYSQQEVDPTWYNPWPAPNRVVVQPSKPQTVTPKPKQKSNSASRGQRKEAVVKRTGSQRQGVIAIGNSQVK